MAFRSLRKALLSCGSWICVSKGQRKDSQLQTLFSERRKEKEVKGHVLANTQNKFYWQPRASPDRSSEGAGFYQSCSLKLLEVKLKSSSACSLRGLKEWSLPRVLWFSVHPRDPVLWFRLIKKKNKTFYRIINLSSLFLNFLFYSRICVCALNRVWLFTILWTAACQPSLSFTISLSLLKLKSIESAMSSNYLILCRPLLLLPSIFPSIRVFQWVGSSHQAAKYYSSYTTVSLYSFKQPFKIILLS